MTASQRFDIGTLVRARGREWVVLPESYEDEDLLVVRPLGGTDDEICGLYLPLEGDDVTPATFPDPDPDAELGNHRSCTLLRDAVRLGLRSGAGPFRSLARIAVEPRPYQLVPLMMALRLDPVRLLIADDVGIGKTVEACLIARELFDRGEVQRLSVLCPPHLADQWRRALADQFHLDATLVLSETARRLERDLPPGAELFRHHPVTVVSLDYIKSDRRRTQFLLTAPELIIVDEAHTCVDIGRARGSQQQRHRLLKDLITQDASRHMLLVTATPHSGNDDAFRSLLSLLDPDFSLLPSDLSGEANRRHRERLAGHFVQRRRGDLRQYLDAETAFPRRETAEVHYNLTGPYRAFLERVLDVCQTQVADQTGDARHQRVRYWSALALLRAVSSSPAAAHATLENRVKEATVADEAGDVHAIDEAGRRATLDLDEPRTDGDDVEPGCVVETASKSDDQAFSELAAEAERLVTAGDDPKLAGLVKLLKTLLAEGRRTIVFCRFIATAQYVGKALRDKLPRRNSPVEVAIIDGTQAHDEREATIAALLAIEDGGRVLVSTDCLSEGINLQAGFDTVVHYDLSWNPTRHEQREGRVDRYGQPEDVVRTITYYGSDNPVDGIVLEVLLRKHEAIHRELGYSVPVPTDTNAVVEAVLQGLMLRGKDAVGKNASQLALPGLFDPTAELTRAWRKAADREKQSRTVYAHRPLERAINEDVAREIDAVRQAIGGAADVRAFVLHACDSLGIPAKSGADGVTALTLDTLPAELGEVFGDDHKAQLRVSFGERPRPGTIHLTRTHPLVEALAAWLLEGALDPERRDAIARRAGVIRTHAVSVRTTLCFVRARYHIVARDPSGESRALLAEDLLLQAFEGSPHTPTWLDETSSRALLAATPGGNVGVDQARSIVTRVLGQLAEGEVKATLESEAEARGDRLLDAHRRVRKASRLHLQGLTVQHQGPIDLLGCYVFLPVPPGVVA